MDNSFFIPERFAKPIMDYVAAKARGIEMAKCIAEGTLCKVCGKNKPEYSVLINKSIHLAVCSHCLDKEAVKLYEDVDKKDFFTIKYEVDGVLFTYEYTKIKVAKSEKVTS